MQELSNNAPDQPDGQEAPLMAPDLDLEADVEELREELSKWQARVPKLAAALRERTSQAQQLQAQLDTLAKPSPGAMARDDLIAELEAKLVALNSKDRDLQGQLHSRDMEISALRQDLSDWKEKWQSITHALDEQASQAVTENQGLQAVKDELAAVKQTLRTRTSACEDQDHELQMLRDEAESLGKRNAQLFETTDLANRQIETLGDSLTSLREQVAAKDTELDGARAEITALAGRLASRDLQIQRLDVDVDELHTLVEAKQQGIQDLESRVVAQAASSERTQQLEASLLQGQREVSERDEQILTLQRAADAQVDTAQRALDERSLQMQKAFDERSAQLQTTADAQSSALQQTNEAQNAELTELGARCEEQAEQLAKHAAERASQQQTQQLAQAQLDGGAEKVAELEARLNEEMREITRLESCIAGAELVNAEREEERRALSTRLKTSDERVRRLESQLEERSSLVMGLEREKIDSEQAGQVLRQECRLLRDNLQKSEGHANEHAEHITQLDARLERQKDLMAQLEEEMAQTQRDAIVREKASTKERAEVLEGAETPALREEIQKLERMLRDRTEELNQLQWRQNMVEQADAPAVDGDSKMLVVLNQQLSDARESNERLTQLVRTLEAELAQAPAASAPRDDDLTRIRGIGPKVAGQLTEYGINSFAELADIEPDALEDEAHPLNALKGRIIKDAWIDQARQLEAGE